MNEYYIVKDGEYLCVSIETHRLYFSKDVSNAFVVKNENTARNIACDYGAVATLKNSCV